MSLENKYFNSETNLLPSIETLLAENIGDLVKPITRNQSEHIDDSVRQIFLEAFNFAKFENWHSAVDSLKKLVKLDPSALNYSLLGLAYYKIDRLNKAANALEISIKLNSKDSKIHFFLGVVYFLFGKLEKAKASFRYSLRLNPKDAKAHFGLGVTYHNLKYWQLAIDSYKEAIRLNEHFIPSYLFLANSFEGLAKEKASKRDYFLNEAITICKQLLEIDRKNINALNALGELYYALRRLEEAEKALEKALKLAPDNADALKLLRMVKEDQLEQRLFEQGFLRKINKPITDFAPYKNRKTIKIKGKPLSETVIEERR
jgi:tetratricopeptide (TPR) repeat protein